MATGDVDPDSCSVCLELFTCPKLLPCYHTFCAKCIDDLASKHAPRPFPCPMCRKPTSLPPGGASALQENFYIKPKDPKLFCRSHKEVQLKYFCGPCDTAVCSECIQENHTDHKAVRIDTLVEEEKKELTREKQRLETAAKKAKGDADKLQKCVSAVEKVFHEKHAAAVKVVDKIRDDTMNALQPFRHHMTQLNQKQKELEDSFVQVTVLIKQLEDTAVNGAPIDRVALLKKTRKGPGSKAAVKRRLACNNFVFPHHVNLTTEQDLMQTTRSFFGSVRSSTQSTHEVTVVDKFNCGDHPNTTVFGICHVDEDPPGVWVSYEQYAESQGETQKFREDGTHVMDGRRVGNVSYKRCAKGRSMNAVQLTGGLKTFNKYLQSENYSLDNDSSGEAELVKVTVTSINPYKAKDKLEFTINVGPHRAHDVDQTQNVLIVVEEATPPSTCRKVLMYRRPGGDPVTTYTPPIPTFQPSDVSFYTLGGQQVLLVSDQANHAIHVVSVGEDSLTFQRFLTRDCPLLVCPTAINVDVEGRLWVACKGGRVLTIQPVEASSPCSQESSPYSQ